MRNCQADLFQSTMSSQVFEYLRVENSILGAITACRTFKVWTDFEYYLIGHLDTSKRHREVTELFDWFYFFELRIRFSESWWITSMTRVSQLFCLNRAKKTWCFVELEWESVREEHNNQKAKYEVVDLLVIAFCGLNIISEFTSLFLMYSLLSSPRMSLLYELHDSLF